MNENIKLFGASLFLFFGIFKFLFGTFNFMYEFNKDIFKDNFIINTLFISPDRTQAALLYITIIFLFSIYSILKAFFYLNILKYKPIVNIISNHTFDYSLYFIFGLLFTLLYVFIAYFPDQASNYIENDKKYDATYKFVGIGTGLVFLITLLVLLIYRQYDNNMILYPAMLLLISFIIAFVFIAIKYGKDSFHEYFTFMMIPIGAL
jgi:hypothetical protein